jgi:hypothetical protein
MIRRSRVYEYCTTDFGKGYFIAKNDKFAQKKASNIPNLHPTIKLSYYAKVIKGKNEYGL